MTDVAVRPETTAPRGGRVRGSNPDLVTLAFRFAIGAAALVAVILRFCPTTALWLDEAQSVAIARLPLSGAGTTMWDGLRQDGSPPLYYLLLHGWISVFGTGTSAVRAMSAVLNLVAVAPLYVLGRRTVGERAARIAILLYLTSPFAFYFASETRMYSLVVLLTALGGVALEATLRRPSARTVAALAVCSGLLALTHYWCFYLLLTAAGWLAALALRRGSGARGPVDAAGPAEREAVDASARTAIDLGAPASTAVTASSTAAKPAATRSPARPALLGLLGIVAGVVVFAPWLPNFRYQMQHTGTPWGEPASFAAVAHAYGEWAGGPSTEGRLLLLIVTALVAFGMAGTALDGRRISLDLHGREPGRTLFFLSTITLLVAVAAGKVVGNAWADRYTATAFVPFLLVVGLGATLLTDQRVFRGVLVLAVLLGLYGGAADMLKTRTQAGQAGSILARVSHPGDVLLVCPDQLGPGLSRTIPSWLKVHVVPTYAGPDRVDWVDYEKRNSRANANAIVARTLAEAGPGHQVFFAGSAAYRTYETLCTAVETGLLTKRPHYTQVMRQADPDQSFENFILADFRPR
ncbi:MAG: glycosyltransferase family 39 protein [Frankia sp.]